MWVCLISQDENGVMDLGERTHTGGVHGMISPHISLVMFTGIPFWMLLTGFLYCKIIIFFTFVITKNLGWKGNTRDYANLQFLLKLPFMNYNIFQCSLTALILTVVFAY